MARRTFLSNRHLKSAARTARKKMFLCSNDAETSSCECSCNYSMQRPWLSTNCFECNLIFRFPSNACFSLFCFFHEFPLNSVACHWMKWEHTKKINMLLCMCGLTSQSVHVWARCIWGLCLSFVFLAQIEPDSHVQYLVTEHTAAQRNKGGGGGGGEAWKALVLTDLSYTCKPLRSHPTHAMRNYSN